MLSRLLNLSQVNPTATLGHRVVKLFAQHHTVYKVNCFWGQLCQTSTPMFPSLYRDATDRILELEAGWGNTRVSMVSGSVVIWNINCPNPLFQFLCKLSHSANFILELYILHLDSTPEFKQPSCFWIISDEHRNLILCLLGHIKSHSECLVYWLY